MVGVFGLQSSYSMLNSTITLDDLIESCNSNMYDFIALSDDYLYNIANLYDKTKDISLKPIIGMRLTIFNPEETTFLIYAKNDFGYENLLELSYLKSDNYQFNIIDLEKRQEGLIIITAGYHSVIDKNIFDGNKATVKEKLNNYNEIFDDFYIGIALNYKEQREMSAKYLYELSKELKIKAVLVHTTSYLLDSEREAYKALIKIDNNNRTLLDDTNMNFLNSESIMEIYLKFPNLKSNAKALVESVSYKFNPPQFKMPKYSNKENVSENEFLTSLARIGLKRRMTLNNIKDHRPYIQRLENELSVINEMGFASYFLIVYDFVKYAKSNDILVGPGRGSAAGSLVSYCLGITDIDPIKYNLLFERFLNPARTSMPDIDLDFPDNKREIVINYVKDKYGSSHICSITTYGTFALRSSIRDIARVTGVSLSRVSGIIQSVLTNSIDESDYEVTKLLNIAKKIEGLPRQTGTHAAGIIVASENLSKHLPMQTGAYDFQQSQLNAQWLEKLGLIKIDFLGIRNLTIIADIINIINEKKHIINLSKLSLTNKKTFALLSKGDTTGIFQLESSGMRNVLRKLKPNKFEDIIAVLALYRPGPMENIDTYIKRRAGAKFSYLHKDLEPILESTYGIIIYQEQVMQIAQVFAKYNLFEADMLRVGISKKDHKILKDEQEKFINKSIKNGHSKQVANKIYNYIVKFANYGFNRSHSVSYSMIAYQMAYLKANYYDVFMAVLLNHVIGNESETAKYISEAKSEGLIIINPDLNKSTNKYQSNNNKILLPLTVIKGIGSKTYDLLLKERKKGEFKSLVDIKKRLSNFISENEFKALILAGALDFLNVNKKTLIKNSDLEAANYQQYMSDYQVRLVKDYSYEQKMHLEKEVLGFNLKYNIFHLYEKEAKRKGYYKISKAESTNKTIPILALIKDSKEHITKKGDTMLFLSLIDETSQLDVAVFPDVYKKYKKHLNSGLYAFYIKANNYNNQRRYNLIKMDIINKKNRE